MQRRKVKAPGQGQERMSNYSVVGRGLAINRHCADAFQKGRYVNLDAVMIARDRVAHHVAFGNYLIDHGRYLVSVNRAGLQRHINDAIIHLYVEARVFQSALYSFYHSLSFFWCHLSPLLGFVEGSSPLACLYNIMYCEGKQPQLSGGRGDGLDQFPNFAPQFSGGVL